MIIFIAYWIIGLCSMIGMQVAGVERIPKLLFAVMFWPLCLAIFLFAKLYKD